MDLKLINKHYKKGINAFKKKNESEKQKYYEEYSKKFNNLSIHEKSLLDNINYVVEAVHFTKPKKPKKKIIDDLIKERKIEFFTINNKNKKKCYKQYKVLEELGKGAFGTVVLAKKKKQKYAVKVIKLFDKNKRFRRTNEMDADIFKQEVDILKKTGEYGISPKLYELYESYICKTPDEYLGFIIMGYLNGGTLIELLDSGEYITNQDLKNIKKKIKLLHKYKIFHGDLHANNIAYNINKEKEKEFFLIDFGFATFQIKQISQFKQHDFIRINYFDDMIEENVRLYVLLEMKDNGIIKF